MNDMSLLLDQTLLSTKDAAALSGYNADYLSRLCRSGKLAGTQVGRTWLVDRASLESFTRDQEERKREIATELSQSREKEYQRAQQKSIAPARAPAPRPIRSPFTTLVRQPAVAFIASIVILGTSVYASTSGPIAEAVGHAGALASVAQQIMNPSSANEPRLRIASNVAASAQTGIPVTNVQAQRPLKPSIDGQAIAARLARIDAPDARAETGHRIIAYDAAADAAARMQDSRARTERAFARFISSDEPITARMTYAYVALGANIRDGVYGMLDAYAFSLNRDGEHALAFAANTRDVIGFAPRTTTALLDTYAYGIDSWVDGSHTVIARAVDTETAAGPTALALADTASEGTHAVALALQHGVDAQLASLHGSATRIASIATPKLADAPTIPSADTVASVAAAVPLDTKVVSAATTTEPATDTPVQVASAEMATSTVTASASMALPIPFSIGRTLALGTYTTLNDWFATSRLTYYRVLAFFRGDSRLAVVSLPPAITVPSYTVNVSGGAWTDGGTVTQVYGGPTNVTTNVTNYYTTNGVTREVFDATIDSVMRFVARHGGSSSNSSTGNTATGDITADSLALSGDATIGGTLTASGVITAPYFVATSLAATSTLPNLVVNSFSIGGDYITDFTGSGLSIVNGQLTASASTSNSFIQGGNTFGAPGVLGTTDAQPLSFITNNLTRMTIDANGNVGIGGAPSAAKLSVTGDISGDTVTATSVTATSSLPHLAVTALSIGANYLTSVTGNGLAIIGGVLGLDAANNYFSTTSSNSWFATKTTGDLPEGSNKYFTDARADARINATSTIGTLLSAPNLATVSTSLTGVLKATAGALSVAVAGTDYESPLTFAAPLTRTLNAISIAAANGSTNGYLTFGDWNLFNNKISSTSLSATGPLTYNPATGVFGLGTVAVSNGGTGSTTLSGILAGAGTSAVKSVVVGSGLTWDGTTLATSGAGITSIGPAGQLQTGGTQTLATTTSTFNGVTVALTIVGAGNTQTFTPTLSGTLGVAGGGTGSTTLTGILKGNGTGSLLSAAAGIDYENPLTFSAPFSRVGNAISIAVANGSTNGYLSSTDWNLFNNKISSTSLSAVYPLAYNSSTGVFSTAFSTTTTNTFSALQTFGAGFNVNSETFTDLTGSGLLNTGGALTLDRGGDWTGTFDGQEGTYYLANSFSTTSASYFLSQNQSGAFATTSANYWLTTKSTSDLAEGSNQYWTNTRFDNRLSATTSLPNLTTLANLGTVKTSLTGILKATAGVLSVASAGTDYENPLTFAYPLQRTVNAISLAFGTTTNNAWSGTNTFTGNTTLANASTTNGFFTRLTANTAAFGQTASTTIAADGSLTTPALTVGSLSGLLYGNSGVVAAATVSSPLTFSAGTLSIPVATSGANGYLSSADWTTFANKISSTSLSAVYPLAYNSSTGVFTTAFSTTTANSFNALQQFNAGASSTQLTVTGNTYLATAGGNVGIGTTAPSTALDVTGVLTLRDSANRNTSFTADVNGLTIVTSLGNTFINTGDLYANRLVDRGNSAYLIDPASSGTAITVAGNVGIGTTTAPQRLSVQGNALISGNLSAANLTATGTIAFTGLGTGLVKSTSGTLSIASAGTDYVANTTGDWTGTFDGQEGTYYLNLANQTGILAYTKGGTGFGSYTAGDVLYVDNTGTLAKLPAGGPGTVLKIQAGLPAWGVDQTVGGGGSDGIFATSTGKIYPLNTADVLVVGSNATSTSNSIFEVNGQQYISSKLGIATTSPVTTLSVGGSGYFTGGVGIGIVNTTAGTLRTSSDVTVGGAFSAAGNATLANATSSALYTSLLGLNSSYFNSLTGSGLSNVSGVLTLDRTGDWTGTFDGQEGAYYLTNSFSTTSASYFLSQNQGGAFATTSADYWLTTKSTSNLVEGSNKYYTDTRVNDFIAASTTIPKAYSSNTFTGANTFNGTFTLGTLNGPLQANNGVVSATTSISVLYGGTGSTTLTGILKGNGTGSVLTAVAGTDYEVPLTFSAPLSRVGNTISIPVATSGANGYLSSADWSAFNNKISSSSLSAVYPLAYNSSTGVFTTAFSTTTANSFNALQQFNAGATSTQLTVTGNTYLATAGGFVGVGTTTPGSLLSIGGIANFTTATTTFYAAGGINLTGGCFAINGTCLTLSSFSGTLAVANGGTGSTTLTGLLKGNGTGSVLTAVAGTDYEVPLTFNSPLSRVGNTISIPAANGSTNGYLTSTDWNVFANKISSTSLSAVYPLAYNSSTGVFTTAFSTTTTNTFSALNTFNGGLTTSGTVTLGSLTGLLKATSGVVSIASAGTDYENPLTFTYPLQRTVNAISLAFGTTTNNTWSGTNTFTGNVTLANASTTNGFFTRLTANTAAFGQTASTTIAADGSLTTPALTVGSLSGLLYGNSGAVAAASVSSPLTFSAGTLAINQANTSTNGYLSSTDWNVFANKISSTSLSAVYPLAYNSSTGVFTTAFSTTTSNSFSALQQFNAGATSTQLTVTGNTYLASAGGFVGIGTTTPTSALDVVGTFTVRDVALPSRNTTFVVDVNGTSITSSGNVYITNNDLYANRFVDRGNTAYLIDPASSGTSITVAGNIGIGTTTATQRLSVQGNALISGNLSAANLTATGTIAFTGLGTGLVKSTSGTLSIASAGTDYENALTFTYPLQRTVNAISLAFGTTTNNTWNGTNTFTNGVTTNTLSVGSLSGLLYGNSGAVAAATVSSPLTFTGGTLAIANAVADGSTKGAASFTAADFNDSSGNISIDYVNGQKVTGSQPGFLTAADWTTFANKISSSSLSAVYPLAYNSSTGVFTTAFSTTTTNTFSALNTFNGGLTTSGTVTLGSLNGPLQANNGVVSATTSVGVRYGGTGLTTAPAYGQILVGNSSSGYTLMATSSLGLQNALSFTYPLVNTGDVISLAFGTTTANAWSALQTFGAGFVSQASSTVAGALTVTGDTQVGGLIQSGGSIAAASQFIGSGSADPFIPSYSWSGDLTTGLFHAAANTIGFTTSGVERARIDGNGFFGLGTTSPTTALSVEGNSLLHGTVRIDGLGSGLVKSIGGLLSVASAGTDYENPLTFTYPLQRTVNAISLAFGTTTNNAWSGTNTFTGNTTLANASTTNGFFTRLTANTAAFGQTASTTISATGALTTPSLTVGSLSGLLYGTSGAVSAASISAPLSFSAGTLSIPVATSGADGYLSSADWTTFANKISSTSLSAVYPLAYNSSTGVFTTAFSTTTANSFSALQQFNAGATSTQLTVTGNTYLATAGGNVGIGTTSSAAGLAVVSNSANRFIVEPTSGSNTRDIEVDSSGNVTLGYGFKPTDDYALRTISSSRTVQIGTGGIKFMYATSPATLIKDSGNSALIAQGFDGALNYRTFGYGSFASINFSANGGAGIGTTSPLARLDIAGANNGTMALLQLSSVASFATTTRFIVTNAGNVGIGTTTPGSLLSIGGIANFTTATTTFYAAGGINLTGGCFAINGTCLTLSSFSGTLAVANGGTGSTTLTGLLKGNGTGSVLTAVAGTDYEVPLTFSSPLIRTVNTISIAQANGSTNGYLSSGDWNVFANKISSTSLSAVYPLAYNSSTGVFTTAFSTTTANSFSALQQFNAGFLSTASSTVNGNLTTGNFTGLGSGFFGNSLGVIGDLTISNNIDTVGRIDAKYFRGYATTKPQFQLIDGTDGQLWFASTTPTDEFTIGKTSGVGPATVYNNYFNISNAGNVGIGTTSPYAKLSVAGQIVGAYFTGTTTATSTLAGGLNITSGCFAVNGVCAGTGTGSVTSVDASGGTTGLSFSGGPVTTSGVLTLAGTLAVANGGTGSTTLTGLLKGNGTGSVLTAVAGTDYEVPLTFSAPLSRVGNTISIPVATSGANGYLSSADWSAFNNKISSSSLSAVYPLAYNSSTGVFTTAFSTTTTNTFSGLNTFNAGLTTSGTVTLGSLTGLLKATSGVVSTASAGTDYQAPITATYPVQFSANNVSLAFGTTTNNTWSGTNIFTGNTTLANASTTNGFFIRLTANTAAFGQTASTTVAADGSLTTPSLTVSSLSGLLYGNSGAVAAASVSAPLSFSAGTLSIPVATSGANGYLSSTDWTTFANKISSTSLSAVYPLAYNSTTGVFTTAFSTTTANSFSALQTFGAGYVSQASSTVVGAMTVTGTFIGNGSGFFGNNFSVVGTIDSSGNITSSARVEGKTLRANATSGNGAQLTIVDGITGASWLASTTPDGSLALSKTALGEVIRFGTTGNIGIGTTTPGSLLSIGGIANFTTATSTFYGTGGINITGGCFAVNGACISAGTPFSNTLANGGTATTTFYAGGVVYSDNTKLTQATGAGNSIFAWDNTNGRLGLGTSTPWAQLSINPNGITGPSFVIGSSTATKFIVDNGGRVGIGTSSPAATLSVQGANAGSGAAPLAFLVNGGTSGTGAAGGAIYLKTGNGASGNGGAFDILTGTSDDGIAGAIRLTAGNGGNPAATGGPITIVAGSATATGGIGGDISLTAGSGNVTGGLDGNIVLNPGNAAGTGKILLGTTGGNIGIGTTTPASKLSVQGNGLFSGNLSAANLTATGTVTFSGLGTGLVESTGGILTLATAGTDYENPLTFAYPLQRTVNAISLAFGTTTANTWSALNTFNGGLTTSGTVTLGSLTGILRASSGVVSTGNINLASEVTGTLPVTNGGTGTTTFYAGGVVYSDGTRLTQATGAGNSIFAWDNTNGRLGVGTSTPYAALSIAGKVAGDTFSANSTTGTSTFSGGLSLRAGGNDSYPSLTFANAPTTGIYNNSNQIIFTNNGTSRVSIDANGKLNATTIAGATMTLDPQSGGSTVLNINGYAGGQTGNLTSWGSENGNVTYDTIDPKGKFGIGTTSTPTQLTVASSSDSITFKGQLMITDTAASAGLKHWGINSEKGSLVFNTLTDAYATTTRLVISSAGNLGIGTTTPGSLLSVGGIANFTAATTTFYGTGGINITGGCYAMGGVCLSTGGSTGSAFPFTPATSFAVNTSATTTALWAQAGIFASSSSAYPTLAVRQSGAGPAATFNGGTVGIGTTTPWGFTSIDGNTGGGIAANPLLVLKGAPGQAGDYLSIYDNVGNRIFNINQFGNINSQTISATQGNFSAPFTTTVPLQVSAAFGGGTTVNLAVFDKGDGIGYLAINKNAQLAVGTTTTPTLLTLSTSTASKTFKPQLMLSDQIAGTDLKHWGIGSEKGNLTFNTLTDAYATTTRAILTNAGLLGIGTTTPGAALDIYNGALCVDDNSPTCGNAARTAGTIYAVATAITGIDLAERYPTKDNSLSAGEIVAFDPANPVFVKRAQPGSATFLGVVSTKPGIILGGFNDTLYKNEKNVPIALAGRVPVAVNSEGGPIAVGDPITISSVPGVGKKATQSGQTIGVALEPVSGSGTIQVFIKAEYTFIPSQLAIDATTGNVGIGITNPTHKLDVAGTANVNGLLTASTLSITGTSSLPYLTTSGLTLGSQYITSFTGPGLNLNSGVLSLSSSLTNNLFANGGNRFGTTATLGTTDAQDLAFMTASTTRLTITADGKVGIGTQAPTHSLEVAGDIAAISFVNTSTRSAKTDISYLDAAAEDDMLAQLTSLKVATYRYTMEDQNNPLRLGLIAEEAPSSVLSPDGKGVDIYKLSTFTLAGVQRLAAKMEDLTLKVDDLTAQVAAFKTGSTTATVSQGMFSSLLANAFAGFGASIDNGIAYFKTLKIGNLIIAKSQDKTSAVGTATILAGNTVIEVKNPMVTPLSKIIVTPTSDVNGSWYVSEKGAGTFRLNLSQSQNEDFTFDYLIVQTEGNDETPQDTTIVIDTPPADITPGDTGTSTPPVDEGTTTPPVGEGSGTPPPAPIVEAPPTPDPTPTPVPVVPDPAPVVTDAPAPPAGG